jgi:superfamily II DNA or RNA helicase
VRNRPALVRAVETHLYQSMPALHEVQIEYIDGWSHPDSDTLIWEREQGARVLHSLAVPRVEQPDQPPDLPDLLRAFLWAHQWSAVNRLAARPDEDKRDLRLISPWQSAVQVEDYQLYPVLKAMLMPRISLLLADDVGLGKTIEAGLIISELFVRRRIRRVLIICPASLQLQWRDEMREKFHLDFTIVDRDATFRLQRDLGVDSNPWASYPRIITSMDYLRQKDILASFNAATTRLSGSADAVLPWQMLVVDEVHNLAPSSYGDDSDRCEMLRRIAPSFEHRLFLSATPHNGQTISFTGLLELLDPVRFQQKASLDQQDREQIHVAMVRRLKPDLSEEGEQEPFAPRFVDSIPVAIQGVEKQLFDALRAYREALHDLLSSEIKRERHLGEFAIKLLTKRLLSSSYAFARTWWQHVEGLQLDTSVEVTEHSIARAEAAMNDDEERSLREEDAIKQAGAWLRRYAQSLSLNREAVNTCLERLGWSVENLQHPLGDIPLPPEDARWASLWRWIEGHLKLGRTLRNDERLIIFTEYKHTLDYLVERLRREGLNSPQVESLYGGVSSKVRERVKEAFNDPRDPLRILVGTDTVSEGISLQNTCRYVIHQEIPWNPMRLEQRNGRVDRHGQERDVYVYHFTSDDEADLQFMAKVVEKVRQARSDLGSVGQVIDAAIEEHFTRGGVSQEDLDQRVAIAHRDPQDRQDMQARDSGGREDCWNARQRLVATEQALELSPEHVAFVLQQAVIHEGGELRREEEAIYRFRRIPATWKKLVKETIERPDGALPKLAFDPAYFEEVHQGRRIFKPRTDAELIRLGHPLMQRALGVLRRRLWDTEGMTRWTIQSCALPPRSPDLLLLHLSLEVTNQFREVAHQEIILLPFEVHGYTLNPVQPELWTRLERLPRSALSGRELEEYIPRVRDWWSAHERFIRDLVRQQREASRVEFAQRMRARLQYEKQREQAAFKERLRELERQREPARLRQLRREAERQRLKLVQPALFDEVRQEQLLEQQRLEEMEWELEHTYIERMKQLVVREQERVLEKVLPRRYALATVDVQPLAVEYIVHHSGREPR